MLIAEDAGHAEAGAYLGDLEEHYNPLRYDDDGFVRMGIHLDVARAYYRGDEIDRDLERGERHLEEFLAVATTGLEDGGAGLIDGLVDDLEGEARTAVEARLAREPFFAVRRRVGRLERLWEIERSGAEIPRVILEHEVEVLRQTVEALAVLFKL